jgi:hypothetical protein
MPPPGFNGFPQPTTPGGTSTTNNNSSANNANANTNGGSTANGTWSQWANSGASWGSANNDQDWLALPLDPLLDQWGAEINQTALGPDVGGMDMLDILLNMGGPPGSTS